MYILYIYMVYLFEYFFVTLRCVERGVGSREQGVRSREQGVRSMEQGVRRIVNSKKTIYEKSSYCSRFF